MAPDVPSRARARPEEPRRRELPRHLRPGRAAAPVVERLHAATRKALANPTVQQRLADLGVQGRDMTPQEFSAFVAEPGEGVVPAGERFRREAKLKCRESRFMVVDVSRGVVRRNEDRALYVPERRSDGLGTLTRRASGSRRHGAGRRIRGGVHVGPWYREQRVSLPEYRSRRGSTTASGFRTKAALPPAVSSARLWG